MEIEGTIHRVLPVVKGQSARGEWQKQEVVLEQPGDYNRKVCLSFWGDRVMDAAKLREGDKVTASVNLESREYNGRWFTEVRVWRIQQQQPPVPADAGVPPVDLPPVGMGSFESSSADETDDLPF
ncbi:MAG: DUF3127 domain-containing protein [Rikenellaceae bacterium]|jgi:hypothetical protein|nr:DUF3127 domain-containing protein [Rikenellaceae bacterium]